MLVWSKNSALKLQKLENNIKNSRHKDKKELKLLLKESEEILKDKSLDVNNAMDLLEVPLIISACIYSSKPFIELLLSNGVNPNKSYNPFIAYQEVQPSEYCKNEYMNGLDILNDYKNEMVGLLNNSATNNAVKEALNEELNEINNCMKLLVKYGAVINKKIQ